MRGKPAAAFNCRHKSILTIILYNYTTYKSKMQIQIHGILHKFFGTILFKTPP